MANNFTAKDASNNTLTFKSTDSAGVHAPHRNIDSIGAGANRIGKVTVRNAADAADIDPVAEATFTGRVGEVQASPTANTLLARLKDLLTGIVLAAGAAIIGAVKNAGPNWVVSRATKDSADLSAISDLTAAPTAGLKIVIDELWISTLTAMTLTISEETSLTVMLKILLPANSQPVPIVLANGGRKLDTADKKARIQASAAGAIFVYCSYHSE